MVIPSLLRTLFNFSLRLINIHYIYIYIYIYIIYFKPFSNLYMIARETIKQNLNPFQTATSNLC
jgi:hypothetical protein